MLESAVSVSRAAAEQLMISLPGRKAINNLSVSFLCLLTSTWVWVKRRDLTLKRTLSSFSMGPMVHLITVQVRGPHLSSSDWNSARERLGLRKQIELIKQ